MPHYLPARLLNFVLAIGLGLGLSSCAVSDRPYGHGYVSTTAGPSVVYYDYWYYPDVQVYFDSRRGLYFYYSNNRWIETRVLPTYWRARLGSHVSIHSRYNRPYIEHGAHSRKYPPHAPSRYRIPEQHDYRYQPKAPSVKPPVRQRYEETPRKEPKEQEHNRYNNRYQPKAPAVKQPVRQRYEESPRKEPREAVKNAHKKPHAPGNKAKAAKETQHKRSEHKDQRDERNQDRRDDRD